MSPHALSLVIGGRGLRRIALEQMFRAFEAGPANSAMWYWCSSFGAFARSRDQSGGQLVHTKLFSYSLIKSRVGPSVTTQVEATTAAPLSSSSSSSGSRPSDQDPSDACCSSLHLLFFLQIESLDRAPWTCSCRRRAIQKRGN